MSETFLNFSSESDCEGESIESAVQSEGSISSEKSELSSIDSRTTLRIPEIQVKLEDSEINKYPSVMLHSRCRAAAIASFKAFNDRHNQVEESKYSMELLSADATEKILTFEETLEFTDGQLTALWKKIFCRNSKAHGDTGNT